MLVSMAKVMNDTAYFPMIGQMGKDGGRCSRVLSAECYSAPKEIQSHVDKLRPRSFEDVVLGFPYRKLHGSSL